MVKAEYLGISEEPLRSGKIYKISTRCTGGKLVVYVRGVKRCYPCLEQFLKDWKVKAVYHEQSRKA